MVIHRSILVLFFVALVKACSLGDDCGEPCDNGLGCINSGNLATLSIEPQRTQILVDSPQQVLSGQVVDTSSQIISSSPLGQILSPQLDSQIVQVGSSDQIQVSQNGGLLGSPLNQILTPASQIISSPGSQIISSSSGQLLPSLNGGLDSQLVQLDSSSQVDQIQLGQSNQLLPAQSGVVVTQTNLNPVISSLSGPQIITSQTSQIESPQLVQVDTTSQVDQIQLSQQPQLGQITVVSEPVNQIGSIGSTSLIEEIIATLFPRPNPSCLQEAVLSCRSAGTDRNAILICGRNWLSQNRVRCII